MTTPISVPPPGTSTSTAQKADAATGAGLNGSLGISLNPSTWLSGIGGAMASALEGGFVALLQDIWHVLAGPVYIIIGAVIALFTLGVYFRRPIMGFGKTMLNSGMAAAMMAA